MKPKMSDFISYLKDLMIDTPEIKTDRALEQFHLESKLPGDYDDLLINWGIEQRAELRARIESLYKAGTIQHYMTNDCQYISNDVAKFSKAKEHFLDYISKVDPNFFEEICAVILDLEEYEEIIKTSTSNDGGIDFVAKRKIAHIGDGRFLTEINIFGQAKRYNREVGIGEIRDFLGATEIIRCGGYKNVPEYIKCPSVDYNFCKPFAAQARLFIASGLFSTNAKHFAEWIGLRLIPGNEIARIFHHHRIGFIRSEFDVVFDKTKFLTDIESRAVLLRPSWELLGVPSTPPRELPPT